MITLHTADTPNGHKIAIALEELALDYRVQHVDLGAGQQHAPAFVRISPNGKIPVIVDEDEARPIFESGAILVHLAHKAGRLLPSDAVHRSEVLQWLFMQVGSVGPMLGQLWWFRHGSQEPNAPALERYERESLRLYGVIERRLGNGRFIAGAEYSIADIAMFPWLRAHAELGVPLATYPSLRRWLDEIAARPAVQRGLAVSRR